VRILGLVPGFRTYPTVTGASFSHLLLIPAQKTKVTECPDLLALAAWERLYQARLPIAGRVAASGLGNSTRKVGSNGISLRLWA
jgi:hypothetical protein